MTPEQKKGEHGTCETRRVRLKGVDGVVVINTGDYSPEIHEPEFQEPVPTVAQVDPEPVADKAAKKK